MLTINITELEPHQPKNVRILTIPDPENPNRTVNIVERTCPFTGRIFSFIYFIESVGTHTITQLFNSKVLCTSPVETLLGDRVILVLSTHIPVFTENAIEPGEILTSEVITIPNKDYLETELNFRYILYAMEAFAIQQGSNASYN